MRCIRTFVRAIGFDILLLSRFVRFVRGGGGWKERRMGEITEIVHSLNLPSTRLFAVFVTRSPTNLQCFVVNAPAKSLPQRTEQPFNSTPPHNIHP